MVFLSMTKIGLLAIHYHWRPWKDIETSVLAKGTWIAKICLYTIKGMYPVFISFSSLFRWVLCFFVGYFNSIISIFTMQVFSMGIKVDSRFQKFLREALKLLQICGVTSLYFLNIFPLIFLSTTCPAIYA